MFSHQEISRRLARKELSSPILDRFLRYVAIDTSSDSLRKDGKKPSTDCQMDLCRLLYHELVNEFKINDVSIDEYGFVLAKIPATQGYEGAPSILFNAHVDTSDETSGKNVRPTIIENYDGSAIKLINGEEIDLVLNPALKDCVSDTLIVTDGNTLLGADDKAGIANILAAFEFVVRNEIPHGPIELLFNTDEEISAGMKFLDYSKINSRIAYTIDSFPPPSINTSCFNAYKAKITFNGFVQHPGYCRGRFSDAVLMATQLVSNLPRSESPESTDKEYGYFYPNYIQGETDCATVGLIIRDFSEENMEKRLKKVRSIAETVASLYSDGNVQIEFTKQYSNISIGISKNPNIRNHLLTACKSVCKEVKEIPFRGGTDGTFLTENGIPTPNIFTGGYNPHSRKEFAVLSQMVASAEIIIELIKLWASERI